MGQPWASSKPAFLSIFSAGPGLLAYGANEVRGDQYFLFRPGYMHRLLNLPPFVGGGFYGVTLYEIGKMYNAPGVSTLPNDGAAV